MENTKGTKGDICLQKVPDRRVKNRRATADRREKIRFAVDQGISDRRQNSGRRKEDSGIDDWCG